MDQNAKDFAALEGTATNTDPIIGFTVSNESATNLESMICFFNNTVNPQEEMLKISADGFWVHGVKVEQGPEEAEAVYTAFKAFLKSTGFLFLVD